MKALASWMATWAWGDRDQVVDHVTLDHAGTPVVGEADGVELPPQVGPGCGPVTRALQWILPRLVEMVTQPVLFTPFSASSGLISEQLGCSSESQGIQRLIAPLV